MDEAKVTQTVQKLTRAFHEATLGNDEAGAKVLAMKDAARTTVRKAATEIGLDINSLEFKATWLVALYLLKDLFDADTDETKVYALMTVGGLVEG